MENSGYILFLNNIEKIMDQFHLVTLSRYTPILISCRNGNIHYIILPEDTVVDDQRENIHLREEEEVPYEYWNWEYPLIAKGPIAHIHIISKHGYDMYLQMNKVISSMAIPSPCNIVLLDQSIVENNIHSQIKRVERGDPIITIPRSSFNTNSTCATIRDIFFNGSCMKYTKDIHGIFSDPFNPNISMGDFICKPSPGVMLLYIKNYIVERICDTYVNIRGSHRKTYITSHWTITKEPTDMPVYLYGSTISFHDVDTKEDLIKQLYPYICTRFLSVPNRYRDVSII